MIAPQIIPFPVSFVVLFFLPHNLLCLITGDLTAGDGAEQARPPSAPKSFTVGVERRSVPTWVNFLFCWVQERSQLSSRPIGFGTQVARLSGSEMRAAGLGVDAQFQVPIPVNDFMKTDHSADQLFPKNNEPSSHVEQDASFNSVMKKKKGGTRTKPFPPSKKLRLEAQRVLKERVHDIADKKGIKLRFCSLKECESHIRSLDSPCENIRVEIGWPPGVPFVHPHDLPNKAKLGFLEAYEPGWTASQQDMELSFTEPQKCLLV